MISDPAVFTLGSLTPDTLVRDVRHLPAAPRVLPRLKALLSDANSSLHNVVALIRLDAVLAGRVLQMGNSAYYSHGVRCLSVDEAIHRVGYDQVYELVSYAVASQVLVRPLETYGIDANELWEQSVSCALAAELLAERCGEEREVGYTIGLLHALGMVAIDDWALRRQPGLRLTSKGFPQEASDSERLCLGFTHAEVGGALLQFWDFPREMADPVRYQYAPRACATHPRLACLLHAAKWLRSAVCGPADERPPLPAAGIQQMLGLAGRLTSLKSELERRLREVHSLLCVEPPATVDIPLDFPNRVWRA
ncbi:HDOD domain-containing protein [Opitutus terrae]|nr:HDOD domain-containing protein [Opitutus terrae]